MLVSFLAVLGGREEVVLYSASCSRSDPETPRNARLSTAARRTRTKFTSIEVNLVHVKVLFCLIVEDRNLAFQSCEDK